MITFFYFYHFNGKRRFLNLGPCAPPDEARPPCFTLSEARKRHSSAFGDVGAGIDPQATEPEPPPEPEIMTVAKLITLYLESIKTVLVPRSVLQQTRALNNDMPKPRGERPVQDIFRPDAIALITEIQKRAPGLARNVKKAGQTMFESAVARGYALFNPFAGVQNK